MKVAIAGYTGLIGTHLISHLEKKGFTIVKIDHEKDRLILNASCEDVDAVINLSGINILHRWNESFKGHALSSRAGTSHQINHFYYLKSKKPKLFISASAIGYYGDRPGETLIETSSKGLGFLADLTEKWEKSTFDSPIHRVVAFRLGVVLSSDGGMLPRLAKLVKYRLGCICGDPNAYLAWIHIDDVVRAFTTALERSSYCGVYNLVSENPSTQKEFMDTLANTLMRKIYLRMPKFLVKILLGEAASVILNDAHVYPKNLKLSGYDFLYPDLDAAFFSLVKRGL